MDSYKNWHPNFPVNLANCHDEPIRVPGAVQAFGVLIGTDASGQIKVASRNAAEFLPPLAEFQSSPVFLKDLLSILDPGTVASPRPARGSRLVEVRPKGEEGAFYYGALYEANGLEILEVETQRVQPLAGSLAYLSDMPRMMRDVRQFEDLKSLAAFTTRTIKTMTGFDRVMVYQFDHEWNGEVIAESKEERLEPYLGLHFPHSDIPKQARELYERNWIRIIPTTEYQPAVLEPVAHQDLDLSDSTLRSVSPIHIRYLRNMGVNASMSISLIVDGKLWGLVACHHYSDHLVPLNVRFGCESYGQLISWQIRDIHNAVNLEVIRKGDVALHEILAAFGDTSDFRAAALREQKALLELFRCTGITIRLGEDFVNLGTVPGEMVGSSLAKALVGRSILEPLVTDEVSDLPILPNYSKASDVAGLMAIALSPKYNYYIVCYRPEVKTTVHWAGNPGEKLNLNFWRS